MVLGPRPFTPLAVDVHPSGNKAMVVGCADDMEILPVPVDEYEEPWPQAFEFRLERGSDGRRRITERRRAPGAVHAAHGRGVDR